MSVLARDRLKDWVVVELNNNDPRRLAAMINPTVGFRKTDSRGMEESMEEEIKKIRGKHDIEVFVSAEFKNRIEELARKHNRNTSEMVRVLIAIAIPVMESIKEVEDRIIAESFIPVKVFKTIKMRSKRMGFEGFGYEENQIKTEL